MVDPRCVGGGKLRQLSAPFVVAASSGARIRTSVHVDATEHGVLAQIGAHLGQLAGRDLAARCKLGAGPKHKGRAERKRALTPLCSSRWAGSITRRSDDLRERQLLNYQDELADKQAAVAAIEKRLGISVGAAGGYATDRERFAKQQRLQALRRRVEWLTERIVAYPATVEDVTDEATRAAGGVPEAASMDELVRIVLDALEPRIGGEHVTVSGPGWFEGLAEVEIDLVVRGSRHFGQRLYIAADAGIDWDDTLLRSSTPDCVRSRCRRCARGAGTANAASSAWGCQTGWRVPRLGVPGLAAPLVSQRR